MQTRVRRKPKPVGIQGGSKLGKAGSGARTTGASPCFDLAPTELRRSASECRFYAYRLALPTPRRTSWPTAELNVYLLEIVPLSALRCSGAGRNSSAGRESWSSTGLLERFLDRRAATWKSGLLCFRETENLPERAFARASVENWPAAVGGASSRRSRN